jgi:hypothetical protein
MLTWSINSRSILRIPIIVAVLAALAGPAVQPALADHETQGGMYEENWYISVQFLYQFQWDEPWEADLDTVEVVEGSYDRIVVRNQDTGAELEAVGAVGAEPEDVLQSVISTRIDSAGAEVLEEDQGADYVSATVAYKEPDGPVEEYIESSEALGGEGNPDGTLTVMVRAPEGELEETLEDVQATFIRDLGLLGPMLLGGPEATQSTSGRDRDDEDEDETPRRDGGDTGVDGNTYESPTYGYILEWDEDLWTVDEERTASETRDVLFLEYVDGGFLIVEGYEGYDGDADDCLEGSSDEILDTDNVANVEPLENEEGEVLEGESDGVVFAAYSFELGDTPAIAYFDCQTLVEDEAVLAFSFVAPESEAADATDAFVDIQESLEIPNARSTRRTPRGGDRAETPETVEDETPTPRASRASRSYVSDDYEWSVTWNSRDWSIGDESDRDDGYELRLNSDLSTIDFFVYEVYEGDALSCVEDQADRIETGTFDEFEAIEEADGDEEFASAVYFVAFESGGELVEVQAYLECRTLVPDETVLYVILITAPEDYDDEFELAQEVLDTIETP